MMTMAIMMIIFILYISQNIHHQLMSSYLLAKDNMNSLSMLSINKDINVDIRCLKVWLSYTSFSSSLSSSLSSS